MAKRVQSPSSINVYKQCPRKYFYQYVMRLKTAPSIHTVRGNIVHSVMEDFFDLDLSGLTLADCKKVFNDKMITLLVHHWQAKQEELETLDLSEEEFQFYFEESHLMLVNYVNKFCAKLAEYPSDDLATCFGALTPIREKHYKNDDLSVQGYIDAIEETDGYVRVMDYKTSKRFHLSDEYKLQLGIYALLYKEEHGEFPHQVGIYFLKDTGKHEHVLEVTDEMVEEARAEVEIIHMNTESETIRDYPKKEGPLCKWRTGQCDFYDVCFGQKTIDSYEQKDPAPHVLPAEKNTAEPSPSHSQPL